MIRVSISNNMKRETVIVDENTTLKQAIESNGFNVASGNWHLDGATLMAGEVNKTFAQMGVRESCYLNSIVKADNA